MDSFFQGDTVEILSDTDFDGLASATTIEYIITKPSGEVDLWTATQVDPTEAGYEDYTDQYIKCTTTATDLDELGTYKLQSHVKWAGGGELHGSIVKFKVKSHLPEA